MRIFTTVEHNYTCLHHHLTYKVTSSLQRMVLWKLVSASHLMTYISQNPKLLSRSSWLRLWSKVGLYGLNFSFYCIRCRLVLGIPFSLNTSLWDLVSDCSTTLKFFSVQTDVGLPERGGSATEPVPSKLEFSSRILCRDGV